MKPLYRNLIIIVLILGAIGAITGIYMYNKKDPDMSKVKADYVLQVSEIVSEFSNDENAASAKYIDKVLEVTGPVSAIEITGDGTMNITLTGDDQLSGVICTFKDTSGSALTDIKEGDVITVRGVCSGMLMDVLLNNCALVKTISLLHF